jgi:two-component system KDP operon response regulator KdpE
VPDTYDKLNADLGAPFGTPSADASHLVSVLVIDSDDRARQQISAVLERGGMTTVEASSAAEGLRHLYAHGPDAVVLDTALDDMTGQAVIRLIRQISNVAMMVVSEASAESDKVDALRAGADDYVVKPPPPDELVARIEALTRHVRPATDQPVLTDGQIEIDQRSVTARAQGRTLQLTALEFRLLVALVRHSGEVLSAGRLLELAWGDASTLGTDRVKIAIGGLRRRFREVGLAAPIETVRGFGYRYTGW